jgi:molecular chaperone GrpE
MNDNNPPHDQPADQPAEQTPPDRAIEPTIAELVEMFDAGHSADSLGLALPDDHEEAKAVLIRELGEARQESGELLANLQRVAAEFDNYRKRTERDQLENVQRASQRVIEALLPALDSLDAGLALKAATEGEEGMLAGMRNTYDLLLEALQHDGLEPIVAVGQPFDPAVHEAVSVIPGEGDQVVEQELRKGYVMRGRVIRPTLVIVGHA